MSRIRELDETLSNRIAAGEVVENLASVLKELVENALDADASRIAIELKDAGFASIHVEDDGHGMDETDLFKAFKRHATSKIVTHHDLHHIGTLGFRGEALPSIASVSRVEVDSSTDDSPGRALTLLDGRVEREGTGTAKRGTRITVKELFYNTPARLKHLKSKKRELSMLIDAANKLALAHPDVAFSLINDGRTILHTTGDGDTLKVLAQIYPLEVVRELLDFAGSNRYFRIEGCASKPSTTRSSRSHINLFVNRRRIHNRRVITAVLEAYRTLLPLHRHPIVLLHVEADPVLLDVNIHPQKLTVKFTEEEALLKLIETTIRQRLDEADLSPKVERGAQLQKQQESFTFYTESTASQIHEETARTDGRETPRSSEKAAQDASDEVSPAFGTETLDKAEANRLPLLEYIGQFRGTYLILQSEQGLHLLDQHAAAERIRYERYFAEMDAAGRGYRPLLTPFTLQLSNREVEAFEDYEPILAEFNLGLERRTSNTLAVTQVPAFFETDREEILAETMVRLAIEERNISRGRLKDHLAKEMACKHSIRANRHLSKDEVDRLIRDLSRCEKPFTCPHGRPTLITLAEKELEKWFKRIQP